MNYIIVEEAVYRHHLRHSTTLATAIDIAREMAKHDGFIPLGDGHHNYNIYETSDVGEFKYVSTVAYERKSRTWEKTTRGRLCVFKDESRKTVLTVLEEEEENER